ncbi:endoglucanase 5 [Neltuma alba]|uniref:endoglucanase 5 n=1 Tax=Neltuma alba TaxID=207710 RepID=UPI0010A3C2A9|nr:endoglucanase 5 [Prosopis alba]
MRNAVVASMMRKMKHVCAVWTLVLIISTVRLSASDLDYGAALDKSLMFLEAQRSGKLPLQQQRVKWRGDSALKDGFQQGVDLVGGYYDAGDNVKFGLPMAFSATMLAWAAVEFRKEITDLNQMAATLGAISWATDYFLKAHPHPNVLWGQVGDGDSDHYCWERPEDMSTSRTAYRIDEQHPGSDLAAETAAAFAASAIAFHPYNSSYSSLLLLHAKRLFTFADTFRGSYDDSITVAQHFYASSGYSDELLWAAAWIHRATGDVYYLNYVVDNAQSLGGTGWAVTEFSWDNKYAGLQILLSHVVLEGQAGPHASILKQYQAKADYFACACLQKNDGYNVRRTPGGLMYVRDWNNMQYVSSASFLVAVYSSYLSSAKAALRCPQAQIQPSDLLAFVKSQADYMLGKNPKSMSYVIGYGAKYPVHVHHRGSSIPSIFVLHSVVGCVQGFDAWYRRSEANPNVLYGGLVGGPDQNDEFSDDRSNYEQTEPTLSASAPLVGIFAKLHSLYGNANAGGQIELLHSITYSWNEGEKTYYRHQVTIKNASKKPISNVKFEIENLSGPLWGLSPTQDKNVYELPQWLQVLNPGSQCIAVYIQGGPQARFSVLSFH